LLASVQFVCFIKYHTQRNNNDDDGNGEVNLRRSVRRVKLKDLHSLLYYKKELLAVAKEEHARKRTNRQSVGKINKKRRKMFSLSRRRSVRKSFC
jgi:hypothetical protein